MRKIISAAPVPKERDDALRPVANRLYAVLADLRHCQTAYGLKARHLATLAVMIGFLKGQDHTMVFASNRILQERLNNISLRSLQRALADLVASGMIERRASPNGKRFALRHRGINSAIAFGFDVRPLLDRAAEIRHLAEACRIEDAKAALLRQQLRGAITDLETALPHHERLAELRLALRRKLRAPQFEMLLAEVRSLVPDSPTGSLAEIQILETASGAGEMTRCDSHFGMHHHKSDEELKDKKGGEKEKGRPDDTEAALPSADKLMAAVLTACPEVMSYQSVPARSWSDLREQAPTLASWVGISATLLHALQGRFGSDLSAVAIFCLLQVSPSIRKPGAYLASLVTGARSSGFDPLQWLRRLAASAGRRALPAPNV